MTFRVAFNRLDCKSSLYVTGSERASVNTIFLVVVAEFAVGDKYEECLEESDASSINL